MTKHLATLCFLTTVSTALAAEPGKHSPYAIGPVVRNPAERTIVIPVHYYWKKGDKDTNTEFKLSIEHQGKTYQVTSSDIFITSSQSGWQSVVSEFVIRDWRPTLGTDTILPSLADAAELKVAFEGTADGVTKKAAGTFPVSNLEGPPTAPEKQPAKPKPR